MSLKQEAIHMLSLWSEDILEVWTEVYAVASGCLVKIQEKSKV